jgi:hypothetical protein
MLSFVTDLQEALFLVPELLLDTSGSICQRLLQEILIFLLHTVIIERQCHHCRLWPYRKCSLVFQNYTGSALFCNRTQPQAISRYRK